MYSLEQIGEGNFLEWLKDGLWLYFSGCCVDWIHYLCSFKNIPKNSVNHSGGRFTKKNSSSDFILFLLTWWWSSWQWLMWHYWQECAVSMSLSGSSLNPWYHLSLILLSSWTQVRHKIPIFTRIGWPVWPVSIISKYQSDYVFNN